MNSAISRLTVSLVGALTLLGHYPRVDAARIQAASVDAAWQATSAAGAGTTPRLTSGSAMLRGPQYFEANRGQTDQEVTFVARGFGYSLFLTRTGAVIRLPSTNEALRMTFIDARPATGASGLKQLPGHVNYMYGNRPHQWRTGIPTYAEVVYENLYPGVDLVYRADHRQLKYDLIVAPGADPRTIAIGFDTAQRLAVDENGDLLVYAGGNVLRKPKPVLYQAVGQTRRRIEGRYVLRNTHEVGFAVDAYDTNRPLIIDPTLAFATYLGGSHNDNGVSVAVDRVGDIYLAGSTRSLDFPIANASPVPGDGGGGDDIFVTKLSGDGTTLLYSNYIGGAGDEIAVDVAVDGAGFVYFCGQTTSENFPTSNALQPNYGGRADAFVAQLDTSGDSLVYATFLGGSEPDRANSLVVDESGAAYVTGNTSSPDFPTVNAMQRQLRGTLDAFVARLAPEGVALVFSTYFGGNDQLLGDSGEGIAVDADGFIYVAGLTGSRNFPKRRPLQNRLSGTSDAFVSKFTADGSDLVYSTYFGGSGDDPGRAIAVDRAGRVSIMGQTTSRDLPTFSAFQPQYGGGVLDLFVTRFEADGSRLIFSSYLGGSDVELPGGIALDLFGHVFVSGATYSLDYPLVNPIQIPVNGNAEAILTGISPDGRRLVYSTYYGGQRYDLANGVEVDILGNIYIVGVTESLDFRTEHALQPTNAGLSDAFLVKFTP